MKKYYLILLACASSLVYAQSAKDYWDASLEHLEKDQYIDAMMDLNQLLDLLPGHGPALYNRSIVKLNLMDYDGACEDLQMARQSNFNKNPRWGKYFCQEEYRLNLLKNQFYPYDKLHENNNYRPAYTRKDTLRGALRPERTCFDVHYYDLTARIIFFRKRIIGKNDIYFEVKDNTRRLQIDLFENMEIDSITLNGKVLTYQREFDAVFVEFPYQLEKGQHEMISVSYHGRPRKAPNAPWDGGFDWQRDENRDRWIGVACEGLGASVWWPNKDHLSDEPDSMAFNMEVPKPYQVVSNGNFRRKVDLDSKYHRFEWFVSYPINNYNVTFYMGNYVNITDSLVYDTGSLRFDYYVMQYNEEKAKNYFKQNLEVVDFYNQIYGSFPFWNDGYGMVESPFMGMEHQTAIAYGNAYDSPDGRGYNTDKYDPIIVHEAAHEWWGNSITAADMADAWIHEAFATYSEALFLEEYVDDEEYLHVVNENFMMIQNFWPMVENRDVNENSFAGNDIYMKGAAMLHNLRCLVNNDSLYFGMLKALYQTFEYQQVDSEDFVQFIREYTSMDLQPFFNKFLYDEEPPVLEYSVDKNSTGITFKARWTGVDEGFEMPICLKLDSANARLDIGTSEKEFILENTNFVYFYNYHLGYEGVDKLAYTYFYTRMKED